MFQRPFMMQTTTTNNGGESRELVATRFSQTLQSSTVIPMDHSSEQTGPVDLERLQGRAERSQWLLAAPEPPGLWCNFVGSVKEIVFAGGSHANHGGKNRSVPERVGSVLKKIFPVLEWCWGYDLARFRKDLMAGLTLASLCIPQSIGYATLAKLDPQYGLYTSVVPPLIYAVMGTSNEMAIGPVAVVSILVSSMLQKIIDPVADPDAYRRLVFTATFFAGVFQAGFGLLRLGFLVDFLSHAAIVGFMAGAAIVIGFQQLKGLFGIAHFTNKTDVVSVIAAVWRALPNSWNPQTFMLGCGFLIFILLTRLVGKKNKKLFWLPAIAPLLSVVAATLLVFLTRADEHGVKIIKHIQGGLNPVSVRQLQFQGSNVGEAARAGLIIAVIALTEAMAVGRSFASMKGYRLDGNKEMFAMGSMNVIGSLTSCYAATGSFSRTAVNFSAGCESPISNVVMALTVLITLKFLTRLLYFTPVAILASIILSALPGLIDINEAQKIWRTDKLDFLICAGAFFGVLFGSVEIGLVVAVTMSFVRIILVSIQPGVETLGRVPGTDTFASADQYPMAIRTPGVLIINVKSSLLCFANANFIKERIIKSVNTGVGNAAVRGFSTTQFVILDMSNLVSIDTSGIDSLEELIKHLTSLEVELAIANPRWQVLHKLRMANNSTNKLGGRLFLTVKEALDACLCSKVLASI